MGKGKSAGVLIDLLPILPGDRGWWLMEDLRGAFADGAASAIWDRKLGPHEARPSTKGRGRAEARQAHEEIERLLLGPGSSG